MCTPLLAASAFAKGRAAPYMYSRVHVSVLTSAVTATGASATVLLLDVLPFQDVTLEEKRHFDASGLLGGDPSARALGNNLTWRQPMPAARRQRLISVCLALSAPPRHATQPRWLESVQNLPMASSNRRNAAPPLAPPLCGARRVRLISRRASLPTARRRGPPDRASARRAP